MSENLREYLETLESDSIVAIGAEGCSGFVYIGKAGDFDLIDKCFDNYLAKMTKKLDKTNDELESLILNPPTELGKNENERYGIIRSRANKIVNAVSMIERCTTYIDSYVPVLDRTIQKKYHKDVDDCTAILIKGLENGEFWFKSEFDKKHKI